MPFGRKRDTLPPSRATTGSRVRMVCLVPLLKGSRLWRDYAVCHFLAQLGAPCEQPLRQRLRVKAQQLRVSAEDVKVSPETLRSEATAVRQGREQCCPSTSMSLLCTHHRWPYVLHGNSRFWKAKANNLRAYNPLQQLRGKKKQTNQWWKICYSTF